MGWQQKHLEMDVNQGREAGLYFLCHVHILCLGTRAQLRAGEAAGLGFCLPFFIREWKDVASKWPEKLKVVSNLNFHPVVCWHSGYGWVMTQTL